MNCEDFNNIIHELADYKPMSATIRDAGVSHAALCPDCASRLLDARAVGNCLLAAAEAESEQAPARIKQTLLAAFADSQRKATTQAGVVDISTRRKTRSWVTAAAAVAAVILLAGMISVWRTALIPNQQTPPIPAAVSNISVIPIANDSQSGSSPVKESASAGPGLTAKIADNGPRKSKQLTPRRAASSKPTENIARNTNQYLPLTYVAESTAMDSGTVVRVELSRSALASLGFPVNDDGSGESVKADIVLGDDGVARAIRLVE